jgi:hypothetical protein
VAQELHLWTFASLTKDEQQAVRTDAEARYIAYADLRQSGAQHANVKMDLQNDYTTGANRYPRNRQQTLHLLVKYSKTTVFKANQSEGSLFAQKGGKGKNNKSKAKDTTLVRVNSCDKEYWNNKTCFKCGKVGHPATHCPNGDVEDDTKSRSSQAKSVKKGSEELEESVCATQRDQKKIPTSLSRTPPKGSRTSRSPVTDLNLHKWKASLNQATPSYSTKHMVATSCLI